MPRRQAKYPRLPVSELDVQEGLAMLEDRASGVCFDLRRVVPTKGAPYLQVRLVGFRRMVLLGSPARLALERRFPTHQHQSLNGLLLAMCHELREQLEDMQGYDWGRYTELVPPR